jgi:hypothetical protein
LGQAVVVVARTDVTQQNGPFGPFFISDMFTEGWRFLRLSELTLFPAQARS